MRILLARTKYIYLFFQGHFLIQILYKDTLDFFLFKDISRTSRTFFYSRTFQGHFKDRTNPVEVAEIR